MEEVEKQASGCLFNFALAVSFMKMRYLQYETINEFH